MLRLKQLASSTSKTGTWVKITLTIFIKALIAVLYTVHLEYQQSKWKKCENRTTAYTNSTSNTRYDKSHDIFHLCLTLPSLTYKGLTCYAVKTHWQIVHPWMKISWNMIHPQTIWVLTRESSILDRRSFCCKQQFEVKDVLTIDLFFTKTLFSSLNVNWFPGFLVHYCDVFNQLFELLF